MVYTYSGIVFSHKKKEILPFATVAISLEVIMLGEISQTQKDKCCVISFTCGI